MTSARVQQSKGQLLRFCLVLHFGLSISNHNYRHQNLFSATLGGYLHGCLHTSFIRSQLFPLQVRWWSFLVVAQKEARERCVSTQCCVSLNPMIKSLSHVQTQVHFGSLVLYGCPITCMRWENNIEIFKSSNFIIAMFCNCCAFSICCIFS